MRAPSAQVRRAARHATGSSESTRSRTGAEQSKGVNRHVAMAARSDRYREARASLRKEAPWSGDGSPGTPVRYRRSIAIPEDETCFHVFEGRSVEAVEEVSRRAALEYERIVEAREEEGR